MSKLKLHKVYDYSHRYEGKQRISTVMPAWRNWIRRYSYSYYSDRHESGRIPHDKDAVVYLLRKYKDNGRMLMKTQGQDYW